jgi:hypothetical protein
VDPTFRLWISLTDDRSSLTLHAEERERGKSTLMYLLLFVDCTYKRSRPSVFCYFADHTRGEESIEASYGNRGRALKSWPTSSMGFPLVATCCSLWPTRGEESQSMVVCCFSSKAEREEDISDVHPQC